VLNYNTYKLHSSHATKKRRPSAKDKLSPIAYTKYFSDSEVG